MTTNPLISLFFFPIPLKEPRGRLFGSPWSSEWTCLSSLPLSASISVALRAPYPSKWRGWLIPSGALFFSREEYRCRFSFFSPPSHDPAEVNPCEYYIGKTAGTSSARGNIPA